MKKLLLAFCALLLLASFSDDTNKTITLKDIEGTLLGSYPIIKQINDKYIIAFNVDATTVVSSNTDSKGTHIYLVENGNSNMVVTHTMTFNSGYIDFNSYFESKFDIALIDENMSASSYMARKPYYIPGNPHPTPPVDEDEDEDQ